MLLMYYTQNFTIQFNNSFLFKIVSSPRHQDLLWSAAGSDLISTGSEGKADHPLQSIVQSVHGGLPPIPNMSLRLDA
jgi:hypothetical protein